ncbi:hypothetical protein V1278_003216 [Bradyrhizobium sp. AZCC 1577]
MPEGGLGGEFVIGEEAERTYRGNLTAHYLTLCSPALEGRSSADLVPHVKEWLQPRRAG